jgi:hypothetical protein
MSSLINFTSGTSSATDTTHYTLLPTMSSSVNEDLQPEDEEGRRDDDDSNDLDAEFGGTEARKLLEKKLLWKLDLRMSILIVIYILNYVRTGWSHYLNNLTFRIHRR